MLNLIERELFLKELKFLKSLRSKAVTEENFIALVDREIEHLEKVLTETEQQIND